MPHQLKAGLLLELRRRYSSPAAPVLGVFQAPTESGLLANGTPDLTFNTEFSELLGDPKLKLTRHLDWPRVAGRPEQSWNCQQLEKGFYCPHSLVITDLDHDGRLDIVAGEMTAGGWSFPLHPMPKVFAYINRGSSEFSRQTLAEGLGVHEMGLVRTGDAQVLYAADEIQPHKFPDMKTHVVAWFIK